MISLCVFVFVISVSQSKPPPDPFQTHLDYIKVTEFRYNNENYKILKPTVHKVTDHFKDFMNRRDDDKKARVFLDNDGLRHVWSSFRHSNQNLRKTDDVDVDNSAETGDVDKEEGPIPIEHDNDKALSQESKNDTEKARDYDQEAKNDEQNTKDYYQEAKHDTENAKELIIDSENGKDLDQVNKNDTENVDIAEDSKNNTENVDLDQDSQNDPITVKNLDQNLANETTNTRELIIKTVNAKKDLSKESKLALRHRLQLKVLRAAATTRPPAVTTKKAAQKPAANAPKQNSTSKKRTLVKTNFFCPFFGVITLRAFAD